MVMFLVHFQRCRSLVFSIFPGAPVLIHGDSGVDSTLQVTSLAQLLLDPQYRTIRG